MHELYFISPDLEQKYLFAIIVATFIQNKGIYMRSRFSVKFLFLFTHRREKRKTID